MRINKYLSQCGVGSRRKCDIYISNGSIKINGKVNKDFSYNVSESDFVQFNNKLIELETPKTYIVNKPRGYICSKNDKLNRKIIYNLVPFDNLFSIGRLDYDTTGIILLTNDGDLCYRLSHPSFNIKKKYYVVTDEKLQTNQLKKINKGLSVDSKTRLIANISYLSKKGGCYYWDVVLTEGKNREIKKIFNYFNINVINLHRYEYAGLILGSIKEGKYRKINKGELNQLSILAQK